MSVDTNMIFNMHDAVLQIMRHWYPDISITLIKDRFYGEDITQKTLRSIGMLMFSMFKNGCLTGDFLSLNHYSYLKKKKVLILDGDTLFVGRILDLYKFDENLLFLEPRSRKNFRMNNISKSTI